jgi:hypothetical protein
METVTQHCDRCGTQTPHSAETVEDKVSIWMVYTCSWCCTISRRRVQDAVQATGDVVLHLQRRSE